jgi:hypothetical protein
MRACYSWREWGQISTARADGKETQRRAERLTGQGKRSDTLDSQINKLSTRTTDRLPSAHCVREPEGPESLLHAGENVMPPNDDCPEDDSFVQALGEYREQTWDPAEFADLPTDVQCDIVQRACRIHAANDRLKELLAA